MYKDLTDKIDWQKCNNLIPAVIQDAKTLEVLMVGFMNQEALKLTVEASKVHFWSRGKNRIWMKGEQSHNVLNVVDIKLDCDGDCLLILVNPVGNTCHNGTKSCFKVRTNFLAELEEIIEDRIQNKQANSYTADLVAKGMEKVAQKVGEEATEVVIAALKEADRDLIGESADLLFHLMILLKVRNIKLNDVIDLMKHRNGLKN